LRTLLDSNNISYFKILDSEQFTIDENQVFYEGVIYPDFNSNNCTVADVTTFPNDWRIGAFSYINGTFTEVHFELEETPNDTY
tara:strand:- start:518 stop:766 length:249 start_codon:yes stop_codon:yes gene_type:complete